MPFRTFCYGFHHNPSLTSAALVTGGSVGAGPQHDTGERELSRTIGAGWSAWATRAEPAQDEESAAVQFAPNKLPHRLTIDVVAEPEVDEAESPDVRERLDDKLSAVGEEWAQQSERTFDDRRDEQLNAFARPTWARRRAASSSM